ncbi:hypothetical protein PRJ39_24885 [Lysobacter enzymogenes]|uniref:phage tail tube protein n=1 Tax=Lysobacter enzymogenes TaxID=69 RepID=UPI0037481B07
MAAPNLFSFQGKVYLAQRQSTGKPGPLRWVGNAPQLELALEVQNSDKFESFSGNRLLYGRLVQSKTANVNLTLDEATPENLAEGLYALPATVPAGAVSNELLPAGLKAGDLVALDRGHVSELSLTDSANPPVTIPPANWWTESSAAGVVGLRKVDGFTQPYKATYQYGATVNIALFTTPPPERMLFLDGINTVTGQRAKVTLYRLTFNPIEQLALISEEWGSLQLSGAALFDESRALDPELGGFGRIELVTG